jgi:small subunit ribosomal protein S5
LLTSQFGPPGYGSGKGTPGRKQDKGAGMRSIRDIERQRGRFGVRLGREVSV